MTKYLKQLDLKSVYRSGKDDLLTDFYIPVLSAAKNYDRAVGFFSTTLLTYAMKGISSIVKNKGRMRLIIGYPVDQEEFEAIKDGENLSHYSRTLVHELNQLVANSNTNIEKHRLRLFSLLVACGRLEIKFAYKRQGMYHEKVGLIEDESGDKILFTGSANETTNAIKPDLNFESISVYKSWDKSVYQEYATEFELGFHDLWNGKEENIITLDIPSELYERIVRIYRESTSDDSDVVKIEKEAYNELCIAKENNYPQIPSHINNISFQVFPHQSNALREWFSNGCRGLFRMATGSGKTITAMYGISKIFEVAARPKKMMVVVAVPFQALADQWVKELGMFNIQPVQCYRSQAEWDAKLNDQINLLIIGAIEFLSVVVVNKTLITDRFQKALKRVPSDCLMFVGDECHRHATDLMISKLPSANYRIGLSATPYVEVQYEDEFSEITNEEKNNLTSYYGNVVAEYDLQQALSDGVLTPYKYHIVPVFLTEEESEEYLVLSKEIGRLMNIDSSKNNKGLSNARRKRNRVIQNSRNKSIVLNELLKKEGFKDRKHSLYYVGEGAAYDEYEDQETVSQLQVIAQVVSENGWSISKITSLESSRDRSKILNDFQLGDIDSIVSMRVLDEGIDIPACKRAFILASSSNPRQFVQRRGRILRRYPGKEYAEIFDFMVLPIKDEHTAFTSLVKRELKRVMDFVRTAMNRVELEETVELLADKYGVDYREF